MLLNVARLKIGFQTEQGILTAVDGVSFELDAGRTLGVVGESGCGKSVTAQTILRLLREPPARILEGEIWYQERNLLSLPTTDLRQIRGKEIGIIFQEPMTALNPVFSVGFQIEEVVSLHEPHLSKPKIRKHVAQFLEWVGLPEDRLQSYPHELSGGMRQRVMIAMALICRPKLLIADEPTTALDVTIQAQILELIQKLKREMGMAVLLITHDLGIIAEGVDDVLVMYAGKIAENAQVRDLFLNPLHPYTRGLLDSLPRKNKTRLQGISGSVPALDQLPTGCRFQDRCHWVTSRCRKEEPPLEEKEKGHWVSCFEVKKSA